MYQSNHTGREIIHVSTSYTTASGRHLGHEISQTYADDGTPTGVSVQSHLIVINKYESDGVTINPKWVALDTEFSWIGLEEFTEILFYKMTNTEWVSNEDGSHALSTNENKSLYVIDPSVTNLMGVTLGRIITEDGVIKYYGADGKEMTLPQPTTGLALEFFPGTTYVDTLGLGENPTIRTYTQVTDVGNGLPVGSVVGTSEI